MKKLLLPCILLLIGVFANAQITKLENVKILKKSKLILAMTTDSDLNENLRNAAKNFWDFVEITEELPKKEAMNKAKGNENVFVLTLGKSKSMVTQGRSNADRNGGVYYKVITIGDHLEVSNGKKPIAKINIPRFGKEGLITEEVIAFGMTALQYQFKVLEENNLKSSMKFKPAYKLKSADLKKDTLYIAEGWIHEKVKVEEISKIYKSPVKVVSYDVWRDAILTKKKGVAYSIVVPIPAGAQYVYQHYLVGAHNETVYGIAYPKASGTVGTAGGTQVNITKSNTGFINDKNLEKYENVTKGKW